MPLNSPEDYERLGEHLTVIDLDLANFASTYGYTVYPRLSGGRYPNRRITQEGSVMRSIHISMNDAPNGERFDQFFPDIPYSIWGFAWIDDSLLQKRWNSPMIGIKALPFSLLTRTLQLHLPYFHGYLSGLTERHIKACDLTSPLKA
jgi:hypothetical protein